jgi:cell division protein FtsA
LEKVDTELIKIGRSRLLPAGIVFTGGGAKLAGLVDLAKQSLGLPASCGYPIGVTGVGDHISDIAFTTSIGLVKWGAQVRTGRIRSRGSRLGQIDKVSGRVKNWFKSLVP